MIHLNDARVFSQIHLSKTHKIIKLNFPQKTFAVPFLKFLKLSLQNQYSPILTTNNQSELPESKNKEIL